MRESVKNSNCSMSLHARFLVAPSGLCRMLGSSVIRRGGGFGGRGGGFVGVSLSKSLQKLQPSTNETKEEHE